MSSFARHGVGFGRMGVIRQSGSGGSLLAPPTAPTLSWTTGVTDNTPTFSLTGDILSGDTCYVYIFTDSGLTTLETVDSVVAVTTSASLTFATITDGAKWAIATTSRPLHSPSAASNTVTKTIDTVAPTITSLDSASIAENNTAIITCTANETVTWDLNGGADVAKFAINSSTGDLSFLSAPDFETPTDGGSNNTYIVGVRATDTAGNATTQTFTATVTDVAEGGGTAGQPIGLLLILTKAA